MNDTNGPASLPYIEDSIEPCLSTPIQLLLMLTFDDALRVHGNPAWDMSSLRVWMASSSRTSSAAHAGRAEWSAAATDAHKSIQLNASYIKGI